MSFALKIMVVDNDELVTRSIVDMLEMHGHSAEGHYSAESALSALKKKKNRVDIIITDINMPEMDGYTLIEKIKEGYSGDIRILVLTGYGSIDGAVKAIKQGAVGYFEKDRDPELLLFEIEKIAESISLHNKMNSLQQKLSTMVDDFYLLTSRNSYVDKIFTLAGQVAKKDVNVLITGESGTGKEILARYIHNNSTRKHKRFLSINCSAVPDSLFESEMFGHVKGAYTDAVADKQGFFEQAEGGTLLLDEIGEMKISNQVKLLKVLEEKSYCPVGGVSFRNTDCRVISATNQILQEKIDSGEFRSDLYFRINTIELTLPPLRERREDIVAFVEICRKFFNKKYQTNISTVTDDAKKLLLEYEWPGNIRELRQVIERCVLFAQNDVIDREVLEARGMMNKQKRAPTASFDHMKPYREAKREFDMSYYVSALNAADYNITEVARISGMNRTHLYQKMRELGIELR